MTLDDAPQRDFIDAMTPLFEGGPRFLARLAAARPFGSPDLLFDRAIEVALSMPEEEQIELVNAHPRLGAPPGSVSPLSFREQGYDDPNAPPVDVAADLERLNDAYERRFGFRYCVFVAGRLRQELLPGMRDALERDRATELERGLRAVVDIARDRYARRAGETTA